MNYRHVYHAGNFADVLKHAVLALVVDYLKRKDAGFLYLDTHAGLGSYDLGAIEAEKTGEWRDGIGRILAAAAAPAALAPYLAAVRACNGGDGPLRRYPGSPIVVRALARPQDRLALVELHPDDAAGLKTLFAGDRRVGVHHGDGYAALKALLPPPERRGVVLIDPPFEARDEFLRLRRGVATAMARWATGQYLVWYPIKGRPAVARFHADLAMLGLPDSLVVELMVKPGDDPLTLNGCGLVAINPPWILRDVLAEVLPYLAEVLGGDAGSYRLEPLGA
ncbi:MAG: 23S rRNA (adenine(2030)-N(6))-methyltransferase RlmJ [Magnetospirillum sp.]|nr:23S rRNA (adenine(2030)-N(6))-methyltransferase RlmJ [Magnetospirillum sp.]